MRTSVMAVIMAALLLAACGQAPEESGSAAVEEPSTSAPLLEFEAPEPLAVPERVEVTADDDWKARVHNKNAEVVEVLNIINPVAAYITAGFEKYGDSFSPSLHEEWEDTRAQLTKALTLYDSCKKRMDAGEFDKKLFLDLEEVWQLLVKTGVAGVRTKSMVDAELSRLKG